MNELINQIIEEQETIEQLIHIDNQIMNSSIDYPTFLKQSIEIINSHNNITPNTNKPLLWITDGEPLLTLAILNNGTKQQTTIFVNHHYLALNKWLITRYVELTNHTNYYIDFSLNYNHYIKNKKDYEIIPLGENTFKEEVLNDFKDE